MAIRIGILGYGNLGRGVELAVKQSNDMILRAIFTRRDPGTIKPTMAVPVHPVDDLEKFKGKIDVLVCCGGSATDLIKQSPMAAQWFCIVDSFDTHARIQEHFQNIDKVARENDTLGLISAGWDPGTFSLNRLYASAFLPGSKTYTLWGYGVSQGHSDAIRRIEGVKDARQYTMPIQYALNRIRMHEQPDFKATDMHERHCYVVAEKGASHSDIERQIKQMENYFVGYKTEVFFISEEEMKEKHSGMEHGGFVLSTGKTGAEGNQHNQLIEYKLQLDSNPEFTGSVLTAYARAVFRMHEEGKVGCCTVFDVPPAYLSPETPVFLREHLL